VLTSGKRGWFTDLVAIGGEKVLSRATTYKNMVFFNTFGITSVSAALCGGSNANQSRLYAVDIMTGGAVLDLDNDSTVTASNPDDKSIQSTWGEIPDAPQIIFDKPTAKDGSPCVAGDCVHNEGVNAGSRGAKIDIPSDTDTALGKAGKSVLKSYWIDKE
jgi:Tfp pilus tip-associated adhesin PilY1